LISSFTRKFDVLMVLLLSKVEQINNSIKKNELV